MINERSNGWTWARLLIEIVGKADDCMGHYEPTYRTWLAKLVGFSLRIRYMVGLQ